MKRLAKASAIALAFAPFLAFEAQATQILDVKVICATADGQKQEFQIGWDNENQFFESKGQISRLFCEGGFAGDYKTFISNNLIDQNFDYYNGIVEIQIPPVAPTEPSIAQPEKPTKISDTQTAQVDGVTVSTPNQDSHTALIDPETSPATVETSTSILDSVTATTPTDTQTPTVPPLETQTNTSSPTPSPVADPTPAPLPIDIPSPVATQSTDQSSVQPNQIPDLAPAPAPEPPAPEPDPVAPPAPAQTPPEPVQSAPPVAPIDPVADPTPAQNPPPPTVDAQPVATVQPTPPSQISDSSQAPISIADVDVATLAPETLVELDNGVVLTAEVIVALQLFDDPTQLISAIFTNPMEAFKAFSNIGADMSPEVRKKAKKTILASVIAGGIATQSAATAAGLAAYRRKP